MKIRSKTCSALFKALIALCAWLGLLIQCGAFAGRLRLDDLRYYTLISNLLCAVYFSAAAVCTLRGNDRIFPAFKGALIMGITVTGIVFHVLLSGRFRMGGTFSLSNFLLHTAVPVLSVLDWLLFDEKGRYTRVSPLKWVLLPDIYFVLIVIYAYTVGRPFSDGSRFPYFFIDLDLLSVGQVAVYVVALHVFFIALGYVFFGLDRLLARKKRTAR